MGKTENYFKKRAELLSKLSVEEEIKVLAGIDEMYIGYADDLIVMIKELLAPFERENGTIDLTLIDRARLEDNKFNRKLMRFQKQIDIMTREIAKVSEEKVQELLENTYYTTAKDTLEVIKKYKYVDETSLDILNKKAISEIVKQPWTTDKINFSKRVWNNTEKLNQVLKQEITRGIIEGRSVYRTADTITSIMGSSGKAAERLVRTENSNIYNQAAMDSYKACGIGRYKFLTGGTSKSGKEVCEKCKAINNKVFLLKDAAVGVNQAPMHSNCRCTSIPIFEEEL